MITGTVIALVALAAVVGLVWVISKAGSPRTALWAALLALSLALGMLLLSVASVYYKMPVGWIVALVAAAAVVGSLFVLVGKSVSWKAPRVLALVGLIAATVIAMTVVLITMPFGGLVLPIFEIRGQQIAENVGINALYASDYKLRMDYMPIDVIGNPPEGLYIQYEDFDVQERKPDSEMAKADLEDILAAGKQPFDFEMSIPPNATYTELEVSGRPALGVEFAEGAAGGPPKSGEPLGKQSTIRIIVFGKDGVDVRIMSQGQLRYAGGSGRNETYDFVAPRTYDELVAIGESLAPLK